METKSYQSIPARVLVVEDHLETLSAFSKLLHRDGHVVHSADGYQSAVEIARTQRIDVAFCDIDLWDGNGCDLLKELHALQPLKAIAVTGFSLEDEIEQYRDAGFDAVLTKPVQHSQIVAAISAVMTGGHQRL